MSEFIFPTEEDFVKSAMTEITECSRYVDETTTFEDLLWDNTWELFLPMWELCEKFHEANFAGCHILTEELEDEKCVVWGDWIGCLVFFHETGSPHRIEGECKMIWKWMADASLRYVHKALTSMAQEPHDWG
jgi:hypothetical protein